MKIRSGYKTVWTASGKTSGIICLVLGICVILGGCIHFFEGQHFQTGAVETTAEIIRIDSYSRGENTAYEMTLQFETADGERVTATLDSKHSTKEVGDTVTVFYDPQKPEQVRRPFNKKHIHRHRRRWLAGCCVRRCCVGEGQTSAGICG